MRARVISLTAILLFSFILSSCNLQGRAELGPVIYTRIDHVEIQPEKAVGGIFTIYTTYYAKKPPQGGFQPFQCFYLPPGGGEVLIGSVTPTQDEPYMDMTEAFTVTAYQTGIYNILCRNIPYPAEAATASFEVVEGKVRVTETPETPWPIQTSTSTRSPTRMPTPAFTPTPKWEAVVGKIIFHISGIKSNRGSPGGELDWVTRTCIPNVSITSAGEVKGVCEFTGTTTHLTKATVRVDVSGSAVPGGAFNFVYDLTEHGSNGWKLTDNPVDVKITAEEAIWHIVYTGKGSFSSPTQANGSADFTFSCASGASNLKWCNSAIAETFSGTIPWSYTAGQ